MVPSVRSVHCSEAEAGEAPIIGFILTLIVTSTL